MPGPLKPTQFYADFQGLAALKKDAKTQQPDALKEAAKQFESLFTRMMLKNMRAASLGDSMFDSQQTQFYQDMFDDQLAVHLSQGKGMGLADMLVKQLRQKGEAMPFEAQQPATDTKKSGVKTAVTMHEPAPVAAQPLAKKAAAYNKQPPTAPVISPVATAAPSLPRDAGIAVFTHTADDFGMAAMFPGRHPKATAASEPTRTASTSEITTEPKARAARTRISIANSPQEFIERMLPHAQKAARELGVDPHALVAQAALETGWGKSVPCTSDGTCSYNLFGIKANSNWDGGTVGARTLEFESGIPVAKRARFRSYTSPEESFRDYAALIGNNDRYTNARNTGSNVHAFANALQAGGYATDPQYARKLNAVTQTVRNLAREADAGGGFKLAQQPPITGNEGVRG